MAARHSLPSRGQENSDHSDSESDGEKEASYERIRDQSPTKKIEEGDEIADGLIWALRPNVVVEQEADDFLDGIGEILDEKTIIQLPEAPQDAQRSMATKIPSRGRDNVDDSDSESDKENESGFERIKDQSPTRQIEEGDEISDGLVWALRPNVVAEQEADDFLDNIGEVFDKQKGIEQPEVASQGEQIEEDQMQVDRIQHQQQAEQERQRAQQAQLMAAEQVQQAQWLQLSQEVNARHQAEQNFLNAQAQAQEARERYQAEQSYLYAQVQAQAQAQAEAYERHLAQQNLLYAQAQAQAQELQQAQQTQGIAAQLLQEVRALQQAQDAEEIAARKLKEAQELKLAQEAQEIAAQQLREAQDLQQAQEACSRHKAEQSYFPPSPTFTSPSSPPSAASSPPSSSPPVASTQPSNSTPPSSPPSITSPPTSSHPPSLSPSLSQKRQKQTREESPGLNEVKKRKRDEEVEATSSPPSSSPPPSQKKQKQTTDESPGLNKGEKRKSDEELAAASSPPSQSSPSSPNGQKLATEQSPGLNQGKKRERDDEIDLPRKRTMHSPMSYSASPARAPLPEIEPIPDIIPAPTAPVALSPSAVSPKRAASPAPVPSAPPIPSSNTRNPHSGLAEAIGYYQDLPALRAEIAWFRQQNELAKIRKGSQQQAKRKTAADKRLRLKRDGDGGWGRYRER